MHTPNLWWVIQLFLLRDQMKFTSLKIMIKYPPQEKRTLLENVTHSQQVVGCSALN